METCKFDIRTVRYCYGILNRNREFLHELGSTDGRQAHQVYGIRLEVAEWDFVHERIVQKLELI